MSIVDQGLAGPALRYRHTLWMMRVVVMGAGNVGCYVGGFLSRGADVTLIGREHVVSGIEANGLTVSGIDDSTMTVPSNALRVTTSSSEARGADVVLITTKAHATRTAAEQITPHLTSDTVVISLQNGLRNAELIRDTVADGVPNAAEQPVVLAGTVTYNVISSAPATFHQATSGEIIVQEHSAGEGFVTAARRSGLMVTTHPRMAEVQAAKLLLNLTNSISVLCDVSLREQLLDRDLRGCLAMSQEEALVAFRAAGLRPARLMPLPPVALPWLLKTPTPVFRRIAARMLRVDPDARPSMAYDLESGKRTEVDELQGAIVRLGAQHGVETPVNARVVDLVHEAEQAGSARRVWTGVELLDELRGSGMVGE